MVSRCCDPSIAPLRVLSVVIIKAPDARSVGGDAQPDRPRTTLLGLSPSHLNALNGSLSTSVCSTSNEIPADGTEKILNAAQVYEDNIVDLQFHVVRMG